MANNRQSQFIEMVGDPVENPKEIPSCTIGQVTKDILSGQCLNGEPRELRSGEKAVLKVSAVTYGYFKEDEYKVLQDEAQITKDLHPQEGDLLFSRANTKEYVGATCLIERDYPHLLLPDKLWKIVCNDTILPVYMKTYLSMPQVRELISEQATGTSGSMFNISMAKLRALPIIVPSLEEQKMFIEIYKQSDKSKYECEYLVK